MRGAVATIVLIVVGCGDDGSGTVVAASSSATSWSDDGCVCRSQEFKKGTGPYVNYWKKCTVAVEGGMVDAPNDETASRTSPCAEARACVQADTVSTARVTWITKVRPTRRHGGPFRSKTAAMRRNGIRRGVAAAIAVSAALACACAVSSPQGYDSLVSTVPREQVVARRAGWPIGPDRVGSFELPDGRVVKYRVALTAALGELPRDAYYDVFFGGTDRAGGLRCERNFVGPETRSHFACRDRRGSGEVVFILARDVPGCAIDDRRLEVASNPACFRGAVITPHGAYDVEFGHQRANKFVAGQVVWRDRDGRPMQAMSTIAFDTFFDLYRNPSMTPEHADLLLLHAVALHLWTHRDC